MLKYYITTFYNQTNGLSSIATTSANSEEAARQTIKELTGEADIEILLETTERPVPSCQIGSC